MSTVFTQIINRELPGRIVYEDDDAFCILPRGHFVNPGHMLVIPKAEVDYIFDLDDETYHQLWALSKKLAGPLKALTGANRIGIAVEGFSVPHVHIHLCPLYDEADLSPHRNEPWSEQDRDEFVETFIAKLSESAVTQIMASGVTGVAK
ncbi:HIT family protein [Ferrimonas marina]|uniref:Histidine triad (HIT) family protein n=1 Tax=Ferrimonas marina TaxID=299255 RepID=A0A1M5YT91_9GAMM|nr:HIT family protein [Ferrimonas marina]SHI15060.1 histidine triad (HIT) family protein [Ferrimonas marina]